MKNESILVLLQFGTNIGYAIAPLETTFYNMAKSLGFEDVNIHFSYRDTEKGHPASLPDSFQNVIAFDSKATNNNDITSFCNYIKNNNIKYIFGFDLPAKRKFYKPVRESGVEKIISYYGAPMSSINTGLKLFLKKLEMKFNRYAPDHYVFESNAMRETAVNGRGVEVAKTSVVNLGVDQIKYSPSIDNEIDIYKSFSIPNDRKIIFYSGHMQKRKGVHILIKAIKELVNTRGRTDIHLLIFGNKEGETEWLEEIYRQTQAENHITFGGYRDDLHMIMPKCYIGIIASNGWDSFPRSAIEMQACGLPLIVSHFQGLTETIEANETGMLFRVGDFKDLADKIEVFLNDQNIRSSFSTAARKRVERSYTLSTQLENLVKSVREIL
ncbi:MAG: glycosyltransferase family 4 protein [Gammaproteobacteria bacterium]|nr:glycosyltransferase family 4 protein [Gammaproteobacteria bacterium]